MLSLIPASASVSHASCPQALGMCWVTRMPAGRWGENPAGAQGCGRAEKGLPSQLPLGHSRNPGSSVRVTLRGSGSFRVAHSAWPATSGFVPAIACCDLGSLSTSPGLGVDVATGRGTFDCPLDLWSSVLGHIRVTCGAREIPILGFLRGSHGCSGLGTAALGHSGSPRDSWEGVMERSPLGLRHLGRRAAGLQGQGT